MRASSKAVIAVVGLLAAACGRSGSAARNAEMKSFRVVGSGAKADPTVRPARLVPESIDASNAYGPEGGGERAITAGFRLLTAPNGAIAVAAQRLPVGAQGTTALPERLGGGFLFVAGATIWRSDQWLGSLEPIFTAPQAVQTIVPGLDRVYLRTRDGVMAIDGTTGKNLDLGPWPASPYVASYAAADGWRAAALTDMRGVVATFDAGATWRSLDLPMDSKQVVVTGDNIAVGGFDVGHAETWYEVRSDGSVARLGAPPRDVKARLAPNTPARATGTFGSHPLAIGGSTAPRTRATTGPETPSPEVDPSDKEDFAAKTFGKRPLAAAIEDGWPMADGTAVIAREGALGRVRLEDGALIEVVRDAFPLRTARCHPVTLTRSSTVSAFGFVCGEPRGATVIYAYEPLRGRLYPLKHFDRPRVVTSSGNGALVVAGPCAEDGDPVPFPRPTPAKIEKSKDEKESHPQSHTKSKEPPPSSDANAPVLKASHKGPDAPSGERKPYCVLGHDETWREIHVQGDGTSERVVVLTDGRVVVISPPQVIGDTARMTILDKGRTLTVPVVFPSVANDVSRILRLGLWLDGFEERRRGILGGWIEAGGVMLGIEIGLDGNATPGQYIRDAGMPFVAGRYGLGWTASRRGYETTDGGMTWTNIELPEPLVPTTKVGRRACGPIGCLAQGWLRVGWGEQKSVPVASAPAPFHPTTALTVPHLDLACEPIASMPRAAPPPKKNPSSTLSSPARTGMSRLGVMKGFGGPPVLGSFNGLDELPPFLTQAAPALQDSERGMSVDARELAPLYPNISSPARVYGWGPKTGAEWDTFGRWQVKWLSPFAGWPDVRTTLPAPAPGIIVDTTRVGSNYYGASSSTSNTYQVATGDDSSHALLIGRRTSRSETVVYELEADRTPLPIQRADGEAFGEIESAVRTAGRWFIATSATTDTTSPMTIVWKLEGSVARELARIPRVYVETSTAGSRTKLARRSDGRAIGLVAEGPSTMERTTSFRWTLPIDLESGALGEPEAIGYTDLAGRVLEACTDDATGWVLDTALPFSTVRIRAPRGTGTLSRLQARLRLTSTRACVERIAGSYDPMSPSPTTPLQLTRPGEATPTTASSRPGDVRVTAMSAQTRFPLRCEVAK